MSAMIEPVASAVTLMNAAPEVNLPQPSMLSERAPPSFSQPAGARQLNDVSFATNVSNLVGTAALPPHPAIDVRAADMAARASNFGFRISGVSRVHRTDRTATTPRLRA